MIRIHRSRSKNEVIFWMVFLLPLFHHAFAKTFRFDLSQEYNLAKKRTDENRYYVQETKVSHFGLDGKPQGYEIYRLKLQCVPAAVSGRANDEYQCRKVTFQKMDGPAVGIPVLDDWSYYFIRTKTGLDEKGQVFGIDHARFDNLKDANDQVFSRDVAYAIYNTFIDFHGICNVFAEKTDEGKGIQDLKKIGQTIVHAAAFSEPPVNLGGIIEAGSTFKNGEITLAFKGLGFCDGVPCALIGFDSGESSFAMAMKPMPNMDIRVVGRSHYFGDFELELDTRWVRKVDMVESVITEVALPMPPNKMNQVVERRLTIHALTKEEFEKD